MTQVGHILAGTTIGVAFLPEKKTSRWTALYFFIFAMLAEIPDFRFKYWGHDRYYISHSIFTNLLGITLAILLLSIRKGLISRIGGWRVVMGGSLAWLSHLLLDTFYNHGKGVAMFWPFSDARLALPIPWLSVVTNVPPPLTWDTIRIMLIELATFGPVLVLAILIRNCIVQQRENST
jgi:hypothetical protein